MKFIFVILLMLITINANAVGVLAENSKIETIANISSNVDGLYFTLKGGTGPCADKAVFLKVNNMPGQSKDALNRAASLAMMAFTADYYVQVYNYIDDDCTKVSYIKIKKSLF